MSLLDTLVMILRVNTDQAQDNIDDVDSSVNDLDQAIRDVGDTAGDTAGALKSMAAGALGALAGALSIGALISNAFARAETIRAIEQTSDALGIAIEDVDAFGKAAEVMGGDAEGARDALVDMSEAMGEALSDKESGKAEAFKKLGISIADTNGKAKDGLTGILDLAKAVEGMSKTEAIFKIKEVGITDNRTVEMILKGRQELERMLKAQKEQGVVSKESAENARKLTEAMGHLKGSISNAGNSFTDAIIPALTKVIEWLSKGVKWMEENKDFVIGFFVAIATTILAIYLPAIASAAAATLVAIAPFLLIGAALAAAAAAFALLYDDVMNFLEGNESFIGQISEKYPIVGKMVHGLIDAFKALWEILITGAKQVSDFLIAAFMQIISGIGAAIDYLAEAYGKIEVFAAQVGEAFNAMVAVVMTAIDSIVGAYSKIEEFTGQVVGAFSSMGDAIAAIFESVVAAVRGALSFATGAMDKIKSGLGGVSEFFGFGGAEDGKDGGAGADGESGQQPSSQAAMMGAAKQQLGAASASPANSITSSAISNSTKNTSNEVNVGQVVVQTQATDSQGIAKDVGGELQGQLKDLEHQSSTGVAR